MTYKLAICLLTADRPELTGETLTSLMETNNIKDHIRLHADDASETNWNFDLAKAAGFKTVYRNNSGKRVGQIPALQTMWAHAYNHDATHILHLENDQEFVRPFPMRSDAECVRLYGAKKTRGYGPRSRAGPHLMGTKIPIQWKPEPVSMERGVAHWGGQASITETELLLVAIQYATRLKDVSMTLQKLDTLRPIENITYHIGDVEPTPGHWLKKERG